MESLLGRRPIVRKSRDKGSTSHLINYLNKHCEHRFLVLIACQVFFNTAVRRSYVVTDGFLPELHTASHCVNHLKSKYGHCCKKTQDTDFKNAKLEASKPRNCQKKYFDLVTFGASVARHTHCEYVVNSWLSDPIQPLSSMRGHLTKGSYCSL